MLPPENLPKLTESDLKSKKLTGLFFASEKIKINNFEFGPSSYVFLKDSKLHNEFGPAVVVHTEWSGSVLWFFVNNQSYSSPNPFSSLGYSYPSSPNTILIRVLSNWTGTQFSYNIDDIFSYIFRNPSNERHCEHGPAFVEKEPTGSIRALNYLDDKYFSPEPYQVELNKRTVLNIIKSA